MSKPMDYCTIYDRHRIDSPLDIYNIHRYTTFDIISIGLLYLNLKLNIAGLCNTQIHWDNNSSTSMRKRGPVIGVLRGPTDADDSEAVSHPYNTALRQNRLHPCVWDYLNRNCPRRCGKYIISSINKIKHVVSKDKSMTKLSKCLQTKLCEHRAAVAGPSDNI